MVFTSSMLRRRINSMTSENDSELDCGVNPELRRQWSTSSFDSVDPETLVLEHLASEDLDKLSTCLSEASSDTSETRSTSVFYDVVQAQLALWTLIFSILYSYAWQQHRKKFLLSLFFVVPLVFTACCGISALLTAIVILGRFFSTPIVGGNDLLKFGQDPDTEQVSFHRRHRSSSGASYRSALSMNSVKSEELPIPVCRRHSSSNGSLNGYAVSEPARPPSQMRKLSYCYSHFSADGNDEYHNRHQQQ